MNVTIRCLSIQLLSIQQLYRNIYSIVLENTEIKLHKN